MFIIIIERKTYGLKDVATMLGVSYKTVYGQVKEGKIPSIKIGSQRFLTKDMIDSILSGK